MLAQSWLYYAMLLLENPFCFQIYQLIAYIKLLNNIPVNCTSHPLSTLGSCTLIKHKFLRFNYIKVYVLKEAETCSSAEVVVFVTMYFNVNIPSITEYQYTFEII